MTTIADPFTLPSGAVVPNRIAKAAMTEQLADADGRPNDRHMRLYRRWAEGGAGLVVTGNVQVDRRHLEHPGNIVIDGPPDPARMQALKELAAAAQSRGGLAIMQLSHAGRQTPKVVNKEPLSPSAVGLGLPGGTFAAPKAMTGDDIRDVEQQFVYGAAIAAETGFAGVQLHAAHGYLLSSFLNPRANTRTDEFGGSIANRARLLLTIVERVRRDAPAHFVVSVKLNSSDFQKGGLTTEDSLTIATWLADREIDLLEISGGNYEQPAMMDLEGIDKRHEERKAESTRRREAYFLEFAETLRARIDLPLMVTGGFRSVAGMNSALDGGACDIVGLARPLCVRPDFPAAAIAGLADSVSAYEKRLAIGPGWLGPHSPFNIVKAVNGFSAMAFFYRNIERMGDGLDPVDRMNILQAFIRGQMETSRKAKALP